MLLYNVYYPQSRSYDRDVTWDYLRRMADDRRNDGATAECTNGEPARYTLAHGEWVRDKES